MSKVKSVLVTHLETIVILVTFIPLYFTLCLGLVLLGIPCLAIRFFINTLARFLHPDWVGLMRGKDVIVGADNLQNPRNVLLWYNTLDASVTLQEILRNFSELIVERRNSSGDLLYPKYRQYFESWWGYNFWKWDHNFDIKNHIKFLPGSNDFKVTTEQEVMTRLGDLIMAPFPEKRPYWECYCVPNYVPSGSDTTSAQKRTMVIYRIHHGIGDGYSFLKCFMQHLCNDNLEKMVKLKDTPTKRDGPIRKLGRLIWTLIQAPYCLVRQCLLDIDNSSEWFLPRGQLSGKCHVAQTRPISIPDIKDICKEFKVTFTSVLFAALAGGVGQHFKRKYFGSKERQIPGNIRCFTPFPWRNHPNNKLINHWTCASVPLFPSIDSAQERMYLTEQYLQTLKASPIPLANHLLLPLAAAFPVRVVQLGNWFNTAIVSNFPGPTQHVEYYKRYRVEDLNFWAPHLNGKSGIGITMISYGSVMRIGLNFDQAILPHQQDVDHLCRYIEHEFDKLFRKTSRKAEEELQPVTVTTKLFPNDEPPQRRLDTKLLRHRSVS